MAFGIRDNQETEIACALPSQMAIKSAGIHQVSGVSPTSVIYNMSNTQDMEARQTRRDTLCPTPNNLTYVCVFV